MWDSGVDLALAKIIALETTVGESVGVPRFSYVQLAGQAPHRGAEIICVGQPGRDDLESKSRRKTKYNLVEISEGCFRGMVPGVDPLDNEEIGTLMHDAWTYWGHSGAPLLSRDSGMLVGIHSSWDDKTTMRHGVPLVAVKWFIERNLTIIGNLETRRISNGETED